MLKVVAKNYVYLLGNSRGGNSSEDTNHYCQNLNKLKPFRTI